MSDAGSDNNSTSSSGSELSPVHDKDGRLVGSFKNVVKGDIEKDARYVGSMMRAYTTSHSLAVDIEHEIPLFVTKARERIMGLIQIIANLRKELYDAKGEVVKVNQRLHAVLTLQEFQDGFAGWGKDLEESIMSAETPEEISRAMKNHWKRGGGGGPGDSGGVPGDLVPGDLAG